MTVVDDREADIAALPTPQGGACEDASGTRQPRRRTVTPRSSAQPTLWKEE